MKKIIIGTLIASSVLFASNTTGEFKSKLFDIDKISNEETKVFLIALENLAPGVTQTVRDYFEAKTCTVDFYNTVSVNEIKDFLNQKPSFAFLYALNTLNKDKKSIDDNNYLQVINNYKFLNCGEGNFYTDVALDKEK